MEDDFPNEADLAPPTLAESVPFQLSGFDTEEAAYNLANIIFTLMREFSRQIDLRDLDGVTVAYDYGAALATLDRGVQTSGPLTASEGWAFGIAMTPAVLRDGKVKSRIVLRADVVDVLGDPEHEDFRQAVHVIAHECAHVEVRSRFDAVFPGQVLQATYPNRLAAYRAQVVEACWDEYAATRLAALWGRDPTEDYETTFLHALGRAREEANEEVRRYRTHGEVDAVVQRVFGIYGDLLKYSSYHLGNLRGRGVSWCDRPRTTEALDGHWFAPFFERLDAACEGIAAAHGQWVDRAVFDNLGEIVDDVVKTGGVFCTPLPDGAYHARIPFTPETV